MRTPASGRETIQATAKQCLRRHSNAARSHRYRPGRPATLRNSGPMHFHDEAEHRFGIASPSTPACPSRCSSARAPRRSGTPRPQLLRLLGRRPPAAGRPSGRPRRHQEASRNGADDRRAWQRQARVQLPAPSPSTDHAAPAGPYAFTKTLAGLRVPRPFWLPTPAWCGNGSSSATRASSSSRCDRKSARRTAASPARSAR